MQSSFANNPSSNNLNQTVFNYYRRARSVAILGSLCASCMAFIFFPLLAASMLALVIYFGKWLDTLQDVTTSSGLLKSIDFRCFAILLIVIFLQLRHYIR
ncbi:hypothetical protein SNEBB_009762 [Seison nebaliae]|nr:hypothetical protein SNEBB_009762 [Seison nebaliae]